MQNRDGSFSLPDENITLIEDQHKLTLSTNFPLPADTMSGKFVYVWAFDGDGNKSRLVAGPVNSLRKLMKVSSKNLNLHKASIVLYSNLTKNSTTKRYQVSVFFELDLSLTTLYNHSFVIKKILLIVTSDGKSGDHRNDKQYLICYTKSANKTEVMTTGWQNPTTTTTLNAVQPSITSTYKTEVMTTSWQASTTTGTLNTVKPPVTPIWEGEGTTVLKHNPMKPRTTSGKSNTNVKSIEHIRNILIVVGGIICGGLLLVIICMYGNQRCRRGKADVDNASNLEAQESGPDSESTFL